MDPKHDINIKAFLSANKSMVIAPAGHGKTHTIVDCLKEYLYEGKKILILTHTHAGIASIKEKIAGREIPNQFYEINTICSFTLNLTLSYVPENKLPDDSDMKEKYRKALNFALILLAAKPIRSVLKAKYEHLIIDEYQDCDTDQNRLINKIGEILKVHILGDSMQSIFGFNGIPVDLDSHEFDVYKENLQTLSTPWRWTNSGCPELGEEILHIRTLLNNKQNIDLRQFKHIQFIETHKNDIYWHRKSKTDIPPAIIQTMYTYLSDKYTGNVLILHPITHSKEARIKFTKRMFNLGMLESIDDSDFYTTVQKFENNNGQNLFAAIVSFIKETCTASSLDDFIHPDGSLKDVRKPEKQDKINKLRSLFTSIDSQKTYSNILSCILHLKKLFNLKIVRKDLYYTIEKVLMDAERRNINLTEALKLNRDKIRRIGRSIQGKYIGTTLLTKGLECDTVIILDAHRFPNEKHLYVALSRCTQRLIVASESPILSPYKTDNSSNTKLDAIQLSLFSERDY